MSGRSVPCTEADTILAVSRTAGLNIPSGCNFGVCGTCKTRKLSGEVHMVHNGGISEDDIAAGYILACCSLPMGRVEIEA
jgi:ferredoxin